MGKAIPLRRSRAGARGTPAPRGSRWTGGVTAGIRRALGVPRQVWLAGLGASALALRGGVALWAHLVAEGAEAEEAIFDALPRRGAARSS